MTQKQVSFGSGSALCICQNLASRRRHRVVV